MKKRVSLLLVIAMLLSMVPVVAFAAETTGTVVLDQSVTASSGSKFTYKFAPETDGTLTVTVGDGTTNWVSDVYSFATFKAIASSSGTAEGTYSAEVTVGTNYYIRVYASSGALAATPVKAVFTPAGGSEATEPETEAAKDAYAVSTTTLSVGSNIVSTIDTAEATIYKFTPGEAGTYTITGPEGSKVGIWGYSTNLTDPNSTSNSCELNLANVGPTVRVGVTGAEGQIILTVEYTPAETEPATEATEPATEATEPESEPTIPSISDEDVPAGTYYSITVDEATTYYSTSGGSTLNAALKKITGSAYLKFYQDIELGSSYTIDIYNGDITIDLNGCTITSAYKAAGALYVSGGNVTVVDTSAEGDGLLNNSSTNGFGIEVYSGSVTMLSGNANGFMGAKVWGNTTFNMKGGTVTGNQYGINALTNSAVNVSGGTIEQSPAGSLKYAFFAASTAVVSVTGGNFNGAISGSGLNGKISGGYFTASPNAGYIADGCAVEDNADTTYLYKVVDPNAVEPEPTEPSEPESSEPETEPTEPSEPESSEPETEPTEPESSEPETEPTEPSVPESSEPETEPSVPESSEPAADGTLLTVTNETVTVSGYTFEYSAATAGTLNVTVGTCSPGWRYKVYFPDGTESIYRTKWSATETCDYEGEAGNWKIVFYAYSSTQADNVAGTVSFTVTFTPNEGGDSGEVEKAEYEVSETELALGDNTVTLLDTAETTIFVFEPTETAVYTFTAPEGAILGYWGAGSWFLSNPNSTTNTYEWTCTGVGQSAYIGVSGVDGQFNLSVEKTGDYTVVETPIVKYYNKAELTAFTKPEDATWGSYVDVYGETHTAVLGDDGYYHLDSADGDVLVIDMDYMDIILSAALKSDRPVMYAYMTDEDGNKFKYDIGDAVLEYEAVMDADGYYPVTEDIILFYQVYAMQAGTFTFHLTGEYNEECVWMYCMRTMKLAEVEEPTEPSEPESSEPETEPTEPSEPESSEPETEPTEPSEPESSEPETEPTEPEVTETEILNATVTAGSGSKYTYKFTPETDGTLTITVGNGSTSWTSDVYSFATFSAIATCSGSAEQTYTAEVTAGTTYYIRVYAASGSLKATPIKAVFTPSAGGGSGEEEKPEYEVSETVLTVGENALTLLDTAITTVYAFEPTEMGVFTFTAAEGVTLGYWGSSEWFLSNPNSTTNTCEWTCTGVGQTAYIGVSGVDGEFNLTVEKTDDYTVVETPIVAYENQATLEPFAIPEGVTLGDYVDVYGETHTAVLGDDGYYHLDSVDGDILLIDLDYMDIILSAALQSDRPVMYAYMYDEDGNVEFKYDIGDAIKEYEGVMDADGYYPVTEDIILFYQVYAMQAGTFTFHLGSGYNEDCVWMYCMRTMTLPEPEPTVELTHVSLNPGKDALGYKAAATNLPEGAHVEISLWITENVVITKATDTLRLVNILACNGGETTINAKATIVDAEGNVIAESAVHQTTMRETLETVNDNWSTYGQTQQDAVKALCNQYYDTVANWGLDNILADIVPQVSVEQIQVVDQTMTVYGGASDTFTLSGACTFTAQDTAETVAQSPYANWNADYYVSMDAQAQEGLYLAGNYGSYGWIAIPVAAGETYSQVPLVSTMLNTSLTYTEMVTDVGTFSCGVSDTASNNAGATITVELRLTNPNNAAEYVVLNSTVLSL